MGATHGPIVFLCAALVPQPLVRSPGPKRFTSTYVPVVGAEWLGAVRVVRMESSQNESQNESQNDTASDEQRTHGDGGDAFGGASSGSSAAHEQYALGDLLRFRRGMYTHWAMYVGRYRLAGDAMRQSQQHSPGEPQPQPPPHMRCARCVSVCWHAHVYDAAGGTTVLSHAGQRLSCLWRG